MTRTEPISLTALFKLDGKRSNEAVCAVCLYT